MTKLGPDITSTCYQIPGNGRAAIGDASITKRITKSYAGQPSGIVYHPVNYSVTDFSVAGINLGYYGLDSHSNETFEVEDPMIAPFELYEDFDISFLIRGDEEWDDLIAYRRILRRPSISFYGDKVAQKRWMNVMKIPTPKSFALMYRSELTLRGDRRSEEKTIISLITNRTNYVIKPSHRSGAGGVWVVKYDKRKGENVVGYGTMDITDDYNTSEIAESLVRNLHRAADEGESWALQHVTPGMLIEERFTNFQTLGDREDDNQRATEFKVFMVWGKTVFVHWTRDHGRGLVYRNGTVVKGVWSKRDSLPSWVDWDRVISMAENLGTHKDMFRVDIFAGVPADSPSLREGATREEQVAAIQYVVSESAFLPTGHYRESGAMEEAARLWTAGYKIGNFRTVKNTQIPQAYKDTQMFSEEDARLLHLNRSHNGHFPVSVGRRSLLD